MVSVPKLAEVLVTREQLWRPFFMSQVYWEGITTLRRSKVVAAVFWTVTALPAALPLAVPGLLAVWRLFQARSILPV